MRYSEYLTDEQIDMICRRNVESALNYKYMADIVSYITKSEIDFVLSIEDEQYRNLAFIYLVYYKWAINDSRKAYFKKQTNEFWVEDNDLELFKIAKCKFKRSDQRNSAISVLIKLGVIKVDVIRKSVCFTIPFVDEGEPVISISNYDDILGYLQHYTGKAVICESCGGFAIKETPNSKIKKCKKCSKEERRLYIAQKVREYRNVNTCKTPTNPIK